MELLFALLAFLAIATGIHHHKPSQQDGPNRIVQPRADEPPPQPPGPPTS